MENITVRFAPSPTGALHIGGVRTALYNYLLAKKYGGKFILRIEDTDQKRYVDGGEKYIMEALKWLGLETDENPEVGGPAIFYRQSERNHIYREYIKKLLDSGNAYYSFDTPDELDEMRNRLIAAKVASPKYNYVTREFMKNSLVMPREEVVDLIDSGESYVIRLKTDGKSDIRFEDKIRGWIKFSADELEDKVLMKSDGTPTYHFANVVDDHLMQITHVIRGEEWLPSTPMHISLYKAFGWDATMPSFVHLPLLLKPEGEGKLSKRDADQLGFPIFPLSWTQPDTGEVAIGFKEQGYLPEALLNFVALLGWHPAGNREIFKLEELIDEFSIDRIGKSGTKFDINKAKWINHNHLKLIKTEDLTYEVKKSLELKNFISNDEKTSKIIECLLPRCNFIHEIVDEANIYFVRPDRDLVKNLVQDIDRSLLVAVNVFFEKLKYLNEWSLDEIKSTLISSASELKIKHAQMMPVVRKIITGKSSGPDLISVIQIIGKIELLERAAVSVLLDLNSN